MRNFKTYGAPEKEAHRIVRQIAKGNEPAAALSVDNALAYNFTRRKLDDLCADLNARKPDPSGPDLGLSMEDASSEYAEAKRAIGPKRLIEAVQGFKPQAKLSLLGRAIDRR